MTTKCIILLLCFEITIFIKTYFSKLLDDDNHYKVVEYLLYSNISYVRRIDIMYRCMTIHYYLYSYF